MLVVTEKGKVYLKSLDSRPGLLKGETSEEQESYDILSHIDYWGPVNEENDPLNFFPIYGEEGLAVLGQLIENEYIKRGQLC